MNITKEQQQAIEEYAKDAMDYFIVRHWHHDYMVGIKAGMQEVINNPEKYGLTTSDMYKECFERFIPEENWDEATKFLSTYGNGLAKHLQNIDK